MNVLWSVNRDTKQEVVVTEELGRLVIDECTVGLQSVMNYLSICIFLLEFDGLAIEIKTENKGLSTVPVECHFRYFVGLDILSDRGLKHIIAHLRLMSSVDLSLIQIVAVVTVEIT